MAILNYGDLSINGTVISYEGAVKVQAGSIKRVVNPQVNGSKIITSDISTNMSKITIPVRVSPSSNNQFDAFFNRYPSTNGIFHDDLDIF